MSPPPMPISPTKLRSDLYSVVDTFSEDPKPTPLVISVLASLLDRTIARNAPSDTAALTIFDNDRVLDMSIRSFLERIHKYTATGPTVFVVSYVYLDRLRHEHPAIRLSSRNAHRLLVTTVMVASKFLEDRNFKNSHFAVVGGLTTAELNKLEVEFLFLMDFKLHVNVSVFKSYCSHLEREVSIGGGYQIERALRFMCGEEEERERMGFKQCARVL